MHHLGNLEHTLKLWEAEILESPDKTTLKPRDIVRLKKKIDSIYAAYSRARVLEEEAQSFIDSL